ncbi:MAG: hypothetical protein RhofKO_09450 [Rhodothermales bacterium]
MIHALRRRHRWLVPTAAAVAAVLFVVALAARPPLRAEEASTYTFDADSLVLPIVVHTETSGVWSAEVRADADSARMVAIDLQPQEVVPIPDLLVYWQIGALADAPPVPANAMLLGTLASTTPQRYPLPDTARTTSGTVLLYSLADDQRVASFSIPPANR